MEKRKRLKFRISLGVFFVLVIVFSLVFFSFSFNEITVPSIGARVTLGNVLTPVTGLSDEEAIDKFDESFVYYILRSLNVQNLHNPPFSSNKPKLEFYVDSEVYNAVVDKGKIKVSRGEIEGEDIIIRTTKLEGVKMIRKRSYIVESFGIGASGFEMVAGKLELASKGYLKLYTELTGKKIV